MRFPRRYPFVVSRLPSSPAFAMLSARVCFVLSCLWGPAINLYKHVYLCWFLRFSYLLSWCFSLSALPAKSPISMSHRLAQIGPGHSNGKVQHALFYRYFWSWKILEQRISGVWFLVPYSSLDHLQIVLLGILEVLVHFDADERIWSLNPKQLVRHPRMPEDADKRQLASILYIMP